MSDLDLQSKQRLIGAGIWLLLLVIVVPIWYSNPVNFTPEGEVKENTVSTLPTVEHAYRLPIDSEQPLTNGQSEYKQAQQAQIQNVLSNNQIDANTDSTNKIEQLKPPEKISDAFVDKVSGNEKYSEQWIVRLQAFNNTKQANELANRLKNNSPVYIKYFPKTRVYSVRTGPYISKAKAEKAKQKLDKMLRTNGEVRQLPKNP